MSGTGWELVAIQDLAAPVKWAVNGGPFGSKLTRRDYVNSGVPVVRGNNLASDGLFDPSGFVFVSDDKAQELRANLAHAGDVVVTQRGTLGQVGLIPHDIPYDQLVISQSQMKVTPNTALVLPEFLYYCLKSPLNTRRIQDLALIAGVPHINLAIFREFELLVPPIAEQTVITSILSAFDDLIVNNTRRIEILEEMARAIYREWFVEFRYPGHEGVPLVESELGPIPEGWDWKPMDEVLSFHIGGGWGKEEGDESHTVPAYVIRGTDIPNARNLDLIGVPFRYHKPSNARKRSLEVGDVVMEVSGGSKDQPVGRTMLVTDGLLSQLQPEAMCASFCKLLRVDDVLRPEILYLNLQALYESGGIDRYQVQSTGIKNFKFQPFLDQHSVAVPDTALQLTFVDLISPMIRMSDVLGIANDRLRSVRDMLLPKLVSGEIDVSDLDLDEVA